MGATDGAGLEKALAFGVMILLGIYLRAKFADPKLVKGITTLLTNALLPCVTL